MESLRSSVTPFRKLSFGIGRRVESTLPLIFQPDRLRFTPVGRPTTHSPRPAPTVNTHPEYLPKSGKTGETVTREHPSATQRSPRRPPKNTVRLVPSGHLMYVGPRDPYNKDVQTLRRQEVSYVNDSCPWYQSVKSRICPGLWVKPIQLRPTVSNLDPNLYIGQGQVLGECT